MYAVSGVMQAILLAMCITWKFRQRRLGIDDFGHPLVSEHEEEVAAEDALDDDVREGDVAVVGEATPLLVNGHGKTKAVQRKDRWFGLLRRGR
jgi:hypothetical protein